ncbi:MAG TPA: helix-turn-helix domain-containing protein [Caulobacteraceae bacterium]|jgi:excisionase family DNA binding protein
MSGSLYTVEQAAERLKLHPKTVLRMIREGRLKAARIGKAYRITGDDLDAAAGVARSEARESPDRATVVVDFGDLGPEVASRIAGTMTGMLGGRQVRRSPVTVETAYDPMLRRLKLVIIAGPEDASTLLKSAAFLVENWR